MTNSTWSCLAPSARLDESAAKSISARSEAIINRCDDLIDCSEVLNTSGVHTLQLTVMSFLNGTLNWKNQPKVTGQIPREHMIELKCALNIC